MKIQGVRLQGTKLVPSGAAVVDSDTYFNLVSLLLPGNGTNGAQNNTFLDSSTNNFTVTRNGTPTQGTFSPFSQTGWGNFFNGSSRLDVATSAAFATGTGSFTVEAWVYVISGTTSGDGYLTSWTNNTGNGFTLGGYVSGGNYLMTFAIGTGASANVTLSSAITLNTWHHVAGVRDGSTMTLYIDGVAVSSTSTSRSIDRTVCSIGSVYGANVGGGYYLNGYVSNIRFVTSAVYTSNFTPSTSPLTAIANTQLLTAQSNRFVDNSGNSRAITVGTGSPSVQAFSPFDPVTAYAAGTVGGSGYFDGDGDYLDAGAQTAFAFGTGSWTVEAWVYVTSLSSEILLFDTRSSVSTAGVGCRIATDGTLSYSGSANNPLTSTAIKTNEWTHIAWSYDGTTLSGYINGVRGGTATPSFNISQNNGIVSRVGFTAASYMSGYISSLRVVKGSAVYSGTSFSVPTAPLTAISGTSLLLSGTNGGITDAAAKNVLETAGGAAISTAQSKWGGSSMAFDGTGDYLAVGSLAQPLTNLKFGYENFTLEFWVYFNQVSSRAAIITSGWGSTGYDTEGGITLDIGATSGRISLAVGTITPVSFAATTTGSFITNTWYHLALVRNGTNLRLYANGSYNDGFELTLSSATLKVLNMGWYRVGAYDNNTFYFNGYIDDLRITRGYARYTANFTPPTTAFPTQ